MKKIIERRKIKPVSILFVLLFGKTQRVSYYDIIDNIIIDKIKVVIKILILRTVKNKILIEKK